MGEEQNVVDIFNGIPENRIFLNADNISENLFEKHSSVITDRNLWHGFLIHNVKTSERNVILKIILDHVFPEALLPVLFQSTGTDRIFLARNCSGAIQTLLKNNLVILDPNDSNHKYTCEIILNYTTTKEFQFPPNNFSEVLERLYDEKSKTLDLKKFSSNSDLSEFTPLSQPKLLCFALHFVKDKKPSFIQLNGNDIRTLSPFEVLRGIGSIQKLDLRNNLIDDIEELNYLKIFNLTELSLDGNPLCKKYDYPMSYVASVKKVLPMLEKLDDVPVGLHNMPTTQQNFLCSSEGFDVAEQFVDHFFSLYDTNRLLLLDLYHMSAIFSITVEDCHEKDGNDRLGVYKAVSTNLLNKDGLVHKAITGKTNIWKILDKLPATKHNMHTLSVDLIYYKERTAVISITGTFYEDSKRTLRQEFVFQFKRTFTLVKIASEYFIYNDLLHVKNTLKLQEIIPFGNQLAHLNNKSGDCEKKMALDVVTYITGVNKDWIERLLEDLNYNVSKCLTSFIDLYKRGQIPEQAFSQNYLMDWLVPKMLIFGLERFDDSLQKEALEYIRKTTCLSTNTIFTPTNLQRHGCVSLMMDQKDSLPSTNNENNSIHPPVPVSQNTSKDSTANVTKYQITVLTPTEINNQSVPQITEKIGDKNEEMANITHPKGSNTNVSVTKTSHVHKGSDSVSIHMNAENENIDEIVDLTSDDIFEFSPTLALVATNWIDIRKQEKYAFQLIYDKWMLVKKTKNGIFLTHQDDFLKNLICWKKHFPTYPNEILRHSLHSGCLSKQIKLDFCTIKYPVTHWDFPASVPDDMKPPKSAKIPKKNIIKCINPGCGYAFIYMQKKWKLVTYQSIINQWISPDGETKFLHSKDMWACYPLTCKEKAKIAETERQSLTLKRKCSNSIADTENRPKRKCIKEKETEKVTNSPAQSKQKEKTVNKKTENALKIIDSLQITEKVTNSPVSSEQKKTSNNTVHKNTEEILVCNNEDLEVPKEDIIPENIQLEEIKTIYPDDTVAERTITSSDLKLNCSNNANEKIHSVGFKSKEDTLNKWNGLFEFVPYVPRLALINGFWTIVSNKPHLKFHKRIDDKWVLLKINKKGEWKEMNDDFCLDKDASTEEKKLNSLGKNIFDHIPFPVTMFDFPSSVPSKVTPPGSISIDGTVVNVSPGSNYGFVSIRGQWIAVKKNKQGWVAANSANQTVVKDKMSNMPAKYLETNNVAIVHKSDHDKKIFDATCSFSKLVTGAQVRPLTFWNVEGSEASRPPKLALTEVNGKILWHCVSPDCGKGFVLEDGVWVKVIKAELDDWKATQYINYPGYVIGYYLINNVWIPMKKHILGGKWSPIHDLKSTPSTYWHHVGPEESKPPQKINLENTERIIHSNSNMGFIMRENAWILMEKDNETWKIFKQGQQLYIYKLLNGIWKFIERNSKNKWYFKSNTQKFVTYDTFKGLKKYAPPKEVNLLRLGKKSREIIDEKSGMSFQLNGGVWLLNQSKNGKRVPVKNSNGKMTGFKVINGKYKMIEMDSNGKWIISEKEQIPNVTYEDITEQTFKDYTPLTYDIISIDAPEYLKPPKYALLKDFVENRTGWRSINKNSGYGFIREHDYWVLMKWIFNRQWVKPLDEVEYRYKIINNCWVPTKNENNTWIPVFNPKTSLIVPELSVDFPENTLPNKIAINSLNIKSKLIVSPSSGIGFMKKSDEYLLMRILNGKWILHENLNCAVVFKLNRSNQWVMSTPDKNSILENNSKRWTMSTPDRNSTTEKKSSQLTMSTPNKNSILEKNSNPSTISTPKTNSIPEKPKIMESVISLKSPITYKDIKDWPEKEKPPMDCLLLAHKTHILGADDCGCNYGFVKHTDVWVVVEKTETTWHIFKENDKHLAFKKINNRWVSMQLKHNIWVPLFDPVNSPQTHLDTVGNFEDKPPIRIFLNTENKYKVILNNDKYGFVRSNGMWITMIRKGETEWVDLIDDNRLLGYKIVNGKWTRYSADKRNGKWKVCDRTDIPTLACDFTPGNKNAPPSTIPGLEKKIPLAVYVGPTSNKGFVLENGAWVLMSVKGKKKWKKHGHISSTAWGYMFKDNTWRLVNKDIDGCWKFGTFHNDVWIYDNSPYIQLGKPLSRQQIAEMDPKERPPEYVIIHKGSKVTKVSVPNPYYFVNHNNAWVLLDTSKFRDVSGIVAYKLMNHRWVSMTPNENATIWTPLYDPNTTPITHFESTLHPDSRPPIRIILNEHGKDMWKVIFPNSGYGFTKQNDIWVLQTKQRDGTWQAHKDFFLEYTGYKIVKHKWTRFKKSEKSGWKADPSWFPTLPCDYSESHTRLPPPSINPIFLKDPGCIPNNDIIDLMSYSKFGFWSMSNAWYLVEYNFSRGMWSKYYLFPKQKDNLGYIQKGSSWKLVNNIKNTWVEGKLQYRKANRGIFIADDHTTDNHEQTKNAVMKNIVQTYTVESKGVNVQDSKNSDKSKISKEIVKELGAQKISEIKNQKAEDENNPITLLNNNKNKGNSKELKKVEGTVCTLKNESNQKSDTDNMYKEKTCSDINPVKNVPELLQFIEEKSIEQSEQKQNEVSQECENSNNSEIETADDTRSDIENNENTNNQTIFSENIEEEIITTQIRNVADIEEQNDEDEDENPEKSAAPKNKEEIAYTNIQQGESSIKSDMETKDIPGSSNKDDENTSKQTVSSENMQEEIITSQIRNVTDIEEQNDEDEDNNTEENTVQKNEEEIVYTNVQQAETSNRSEMETKDIPGSDHKNDENTSEQTVFSENMQEVIITSQIRNVTDIEEQNDEDEDNITEENTVQKNEEEIAYTNIQQAETSKSEMETKDIPGSGYKDDENTSEQTISSENMQEEIITTQIRNVADIEEQHEEGENNNTEVNTVQKNEEEVAYTNIQQAETSKSEMETKDIPGSGYKDDENASEQTVSSENMQEEIITSHIRNVTDIEEQNDEDEDNNTEENTVQKNEEEIAYTNIQAETSNRSEMETKDIPGSGYKGDENTSEQTVSSENMQEEIITSQIRNVADIEKQNEEAENNNTEENTAQKNDEEIAYTNIQQAETNHQEIGQEPASKNRNEIILENTCEQNNDVDDNQTGDGEMEHVELIVKNTNRAMEMQNIITQKYNEKITLTKTQKKEILTEEAIELACNSSDENKENAENANLQKKGNMKTTQSKNLVENEVTNQQVAISLKQAVKDVQYENELDKDVQTSVKRQEKLLEHHNKERNFKDDIEPNTKDENSQLATSANKQNTEDTGKFKERNTQNGNKNVSFDNVEGPIPEKNPNEIHISNPVQYYQLTGRPVEERPPKSVCLNIRGTPRRIPLISKNSKIGFQLHKNVWVLLERLSGNWKILHNSSGLPLAYKLIDNRWVSMRVDRNGFWIPTFNPTTTPRNYFETEGGEDSKPPRRIALEEEGCFSWKEIDEYSQFGFVKNEGMWLLMKKIDNQWIAYKDSKKNKYAFKVQDSRWTKFTRGEDSNWKITNDNLPVLHFDFVPDCHSAPPEITNGLLKRTGKDFNNVGFICDKNVWMFVVRNEENIWTPVSSTNISCGFTKASGNLWNLLQKDEDHQWVTIESNVDFESAFDYLYPRCFKRESTDSPPYKRRKIESSSTTAQSTPPNAIKLSATHTNIQDKIERTGANDESDSNVAKNDKQKNNENIEELDSAISESNEKHQDEFSKNVPNGSLKVHVENENPSNFSTTKPQNVQEFRGPQNTESIQSPALQEKAVEEPEPYNSVELYLAIKPNCCLGCFELQTLLRQFRPANNPTKILRKRFRLPDGSTRMLSIPKALPVAQKEQIEVTETKNPVKKRPSKGGEKSEPKRKKKL